MSNSMNDDYFSFMSNKGQDKQSAVPPRAVAPRGAAAAVSAVKSSDSIEFVDEARESEIEVTESFVSDTTIQRIFKQFQPG